MTITLKDLKKEIVQEICEEDLTCDLRKVQIAIKKAWDANTESGILSQRDVRTIKREAHRLHEVS